MAQQRTPSQESGERLNIRLSSKRLSVLDFETVEAYNNPSVPSEVVDKLHSVDIETLTPLEALNFLYELKTVLDKE